MKDIKIRLEDYDMNLIKRVSDKTRTQINLDQDGWIDVDNLLSLLSELEDYYDNEAQEFEDYKNKVDEFYVLKKGYNE